MTTGGVLPEERRARLADLLFLALQAMQGQVGTASAAAGLTPMQAMLLDGLDPGTPLPMSEIARKLRCDTSNATGLVDRLEQHALIRRVTPPGDRRVRAVELTERGVGVRERLHRAIRVDNPLFARLSGSEQEQLERLVLRMLDRA